MIFYSNDTDNRSLFITHLKLLHIEFQIVICNLELFSSFCPRSPPKAVVYELTMRRQTQQWIKNASNIL